MSKENTSSGSPSSDSLVAKSNISSIKLNSDYKSLSKGFEWEDIPSFAVIVGENGSGKTHLLQYIKDNPNVKGNVAYYNAHHIQTQADLIISSSIAMPNLNENERHLIDLKRGFPTNKDQIGTLLNGIMNKMGGMIFSDLIFLSLSMSYYVIVLFKLKSALKESNPNCQEDQLKKEATSIIGASNNVCDQFNSYLADYNIPYILSMPVRKDSNQEEVISPLFINKDNMGKDRKKRDAYHPKDLSSGENLIVKVLEWSYRLYRYGTFNNRPLSKPNSIL